MGLVLKMVVLLLVVVIEMRVAVEAGGLQGLPATRAVTRIPAAYMH